MTRLLAILFALWCSAAQAQVRASIDGPRTVKPGQLVSLDAAGSSASGLAWLIFPPETEHRQVNGNKELLFASGCKPGASYSIVLIAINLDEQNQATIDTETHIVTVEGAAPPPEPNPPSPPSPPGPVDPVLPDGQFGMAKLAYQWSQQLPSSLKAKQRQLAPNYRAVSSGIAAGGIQSFEAADAELKRRNEPILGGEIETWRVQFAQKIYPKLDEFWEAGRMTTVNQYGVVLGEIAIGLEAVQ